MTEKKINSIRISKLSLIVTPVIMFMSYISMATEMPVSSGPLKIDFRDLIKSVPEAYHGKLWLRTKFEFTPPVNTPSASTQGTSSNPDVKIEQNILLPATESQKTSCAQFDYERDCAAPGLHMNITIAIFQCEGGTVHDIIAFNKAPGEKPTIYYDETYVTGHEVQQNSFKFCLKPQDAKTSNF